MNQVVLSGTSTPLPMDPILTSTPVRDSSPLSDTICSPESPDSPTLDISLLTSVDEELNVSDAEESDDSTLLRQSSPPSTPPTLLTAHASCDQPLSINSGYKLVFDNIDKTVKPRHMTMDSQTQSLHFVQAYAVKDRIDYSCFSDQRRSDEVSLYSILPSTEDYSTLKKHFIVHVSRLIATHLTFFSEDFHGLTPRHIAHQYSKEMGCKSEVVRLAVQSSLLQMYSV